MRLCRAARPLVLWLLAAAPGPAAADPGTPVFEVGTGDVREGYERADYRTRSTALPAGAGRPLDLARRARLPPLGLPPLPAALPPLDPDAVALGRALFFDRRLSVNGTLSCGMCHVPEQGFTQNELRTPVGLEGRAVRRNAPALYNVAHRPALFHDGRETSLEAQIWSPLLAVNEMGNPDREAVLGRIAGLDDYAERFGAAFPEGLTAATLGRALASYQRGLVSGDSPFDRWYFGSNAKPGRSGRPAANGQWPAGSRPGGRAHSLGSGGGSSRGFEVFRSAGCASCHTVAADHAHFTDDAFHNTGIGYRSAADRGVPARIQLAPGVFVRPAVALTVPRLDDVGRFEVTGVATDRRRYRTPSLRNVALTAPYMHDGSLPTLAAVVAYYDAGGSGDPEQDRRIRPLQLGAADAAALVAFLESLTGSDVDALAADARSVAIGDR